MGFGFNFFFLFILLPLTGITLVVWLIYKKQWIGKTIGFIWLGIITLILLSGFLNWITSKTKLEKSDYYGTYIINRNYFKGKQADWQYNNFRFEITDQDSILFYVTNKEQILETYRGTIKTITPYGSARLLIEMEQPNHHILISNPTTYRDIWDFYLVFNSPKFHNVFFKKGTWKSID